MINSIVCRELVFLALKVVVRWAAKWVVPKAGRYNEATLPVTHSGAFAGHGDTSCFYTVHLWGGDAVDSHYLWGCSQLWPDPQQSNTEKDNPPKRAQYSQKERPQSRSREVKLLRDPDDN